MAERVWPLPVWLAVISSAVSGGGVALALRVVPHASQEAAHDRTLAQTPERCAETFIAAYTRGDYERAARFAGRELARALRARARSKRLGATSLPTQERRLLVEESFFLTQGRIRLTGSTTLDAAEGSSPSSDRQVALILAKEGDRFLVEELSWPEQASTEEP